MKKAQMTVDTRLQIALVGQTIWKISFRRILGLNRNEFKNFENKLAQEVEAGKKVNLKLEMHYPGDSFRPDAITAVTTIDGKQEVKVFLNDQYL